MISVVLFASVFAVFYGLEFVIEHFIFSSTNAKYTSAIQSEQRKLLETRTILRELEVTLESVSRVTGNDYHTTTTSTVYKQENINLDYDNTSLVVYSPSDEATCLVPLVYLGSAIAFFVLVFLISTLLKERKRKENHKTRDEENESEVFEDCAEELCEDSSCGDPDNLEVEWFDACAELSDANEIIDVFEECVEHLGQESSASDTDEYEDCVAEFAKEPIDMNHSGLLSVSNDEKEDVLIAFGDFTVQQTKEFMETTGFVLHLPEEKSDSNPSRKSEDQGKEDEKELVKEEGIDAFKTDTEISNTKNTAPLARELQAWKPTEEDVEAELECLEKESQNSKDDTIFSPEDMYRLNPEVQSTFLEDLSQYPTKLDLSSLSKEQIEFAERMADEIMKENKQRKNKQRRKNSKRKRKY